MTYDQILEKIKLKSSGIIKDWESLRYEKIYSALNDGLRDISNKARFTTKQASLSIVAGTSDYTISTAVATDVGEIYQIQLSTGEIVGKSLEEFEEIKTREVTAESETATSTGTPLYYKVWNA
jgi:hypothetical protein